MNKLKGTLTGGAIGFIIGITGLLLLRAEAGSTGSARTPLMTIITIILLIIGAAIGYFILGKTTRPPRVSQPPKTMSTPKIITVIVLGVVVGAVLAFLTGGILIYIEAHTMETTVNGWSTTLNYGEWGNNILERAAFAQVLPAANVPAGGGGVLVDDRGQHGYPTERNP